jgi:hypothetical protein
MTQPNNTGASRAAVAAKVVSISVLQRIPPSGIDTQRTQCMAVLCCHVPTYIHRLGTKFLSWRCVGSGNQYERDVL